MSPAPPADLLQLPVLVVYAPEGGITSDEQALAYGGDRVVAVPGGHMVMWSAFDQTADAVLRFLDS